jgi:hypothetical protein
MARRSAADLLRQFGLPTDTTRRGRRYITCPRCSESRSPAHRKCKCLGITIDSWGIRFGCNHCDWSGGASYDTANNNTWGEFEATYDYVDEEGNLLFQVCRSRSADGSKKFFQRRPDNDGRWINNIQGVRRVLFRLPELIEAIGGGRVVLVVEGEKDVLSLAKIGIVATCNPGGAAPVDAKRPKWLPEYSEMLRGADVVIIPDNDSPGRTHAAAVASILSGITKRVRTLPLAQHWPECPTGGDATDWLNAAHTREELDRLIEQAPDWEPPDAEQQTDGAKAQAEVQEQQLINELARLGQFEYERRRSDAARDLGIRREALDDAVEHQRQEHRAATLLFGHWVIEPWPEEVDTGALISDFIRRIKQHVVLSDDAALAVALWILVAWVHADAAVHSPILWVTSAEPDSGKTTLSALVGFMAPRGLIAAEISEAALFRSIELWLPTIVVTEADVILVQNEPLRAVVNSGWTRGAGVLRCVGDAQVPHLFPTFAPKVIDMLGRRLPPSTLSRCIKVELKRKLDKESRDDFDHIDDAGLQQLRSQALRWSLDNADALKGAKPTLDGFNNRLRQNWRLQIAIADLAGGDWPEKARDAAQRLALVVRQEAASDRVRLLADIRAILEPDNAKPIDAIASKTLVEKLTEDPDGFWAEYPKDKPLTQRRLAMLLEPIHAPEQVQIAPNVQARGYLRAWFQDAWNRYLPKSEDNL